MSLGIIFTTRVLSHKIKKPGAITDSRRISFVPSILEEISDGNNIILIINIYNNKSDHHNIIHNIII